MDGICSQKQTLKSIAQSGFLDVPRRIQQGSGTLHLRTPTAPTALRPKRPQWEIIYSQRLFSIQGQRKRLDREAFLSSLCFLLLSPAWVKSGARFESVRRWRNGKGTDSLACGRAIPVETVHWTVSKSRLSNPSSPNTKKNESKSNDLLSFGGGGRIRTIEAKRSRFTVCPLWPLGNSPRYEILFCLNGAGRRTRTPDLLITKIEKVGKIIILRTYCDVL